MDRMKNLRINKGNSIKNLRWVVMVLFTALLVTPALANPGLYTGCLDSKKGTLYDIQNGSEPMTPCKTGDTVVSFYDSNTVNALEARVAALENLLNNVTRSGNDIYITGANLHVTSGSGATDGQINGLGNLIIGYNELRASGDDRTGSNNLILGTENNYMSYGGLVAGQRNEISAPYASVSGGTNNKAIGRTSSVSGGNVNTARGADSSVSGGAGNRASGVDSSVSGGASNEASGDESSVSGGVQNTASGGESSVSGGVQNTASNLASSVSGGAGNRASGADSSVSGGVINMASGLASSVSGGRNNTASGDESSVSGGLTRSVFGEYDWRAGGLFQTQ